MEISTQTKQNETELDEEQETSNYTVEKKTVQNDDATSDRVDKINRYRQKSEQFNNDTKKQIDIEPNIPFSILFFKDWYLSYDDLIDEGVKVKKMKPLEAADYADKNYRVKQTVETGKESGEEYSKTIYRVTVPDSSYPEFIRELSLTSKKAITLIEEKLQELSLEKDSRILMQINKKGGKTKFDVKWEIEAHST